MDVRENVDSVVARVVGAVVGIGGDVSRAADRVSGDQVLDAAGHGGRILDHEEVSGGGDGEAIGMGEPRLHECGSFDEAWGALRAEHVEYGLSDVLGVTRSEAPLLHRWHLGRKNKSASASASSKASGLTRSRALR